MADRRAQVQRLAAFSIFAWLIFGGLVGCATVDQRVANDGQHHSAATEIQPEQTIQLSSFHALDSDLHDPLVATAVVSGSSLSRLQVSAQRMARTAYDDVVGIVNRIQQAPLG